MKLLSEAEVREIKEIVDVPLDNLLDVYKVCLQMRQICEQEHGIGLAAIQVGVPWRLFLIKHQDSYGYYLNCDYTPNDDDQVISVEGCLSLRGPRNSLKQFQVPRFKNIKLVGKRLSIPNLELININEDRDLEHEAIVFQHEIDHCRLVLINDIGKEIAFWRTAR